MFKIWSRLSVCTKKEVRDLKWLKTTTSQTTQINQSLVMKISRNGEKGTNDYFLAIAYMLLQGLRCTDRTDDVGSVICLWTLSLLRVWTWLFSTLACTSREMSGDVWLIFRPDSRTGKTNGGHDASITQSSSLSSLSSPSTYKEINWVTSSIVEMGKIGDYFSW